MKVSAFTFIKNGNILGYPFIESIMSVLPIVDEFVVNVGESDDGTLEDIRKIDSKKIKIIQSSWNEKMSDRGYVYGQQKMIAQFNCTGDWAFYVEGDELYHENDLKKIQETMLKYLNNSSVEALVFDFHHFYVNGKTVLDSPGWYRSEARIIKNTIRTYAPDGLFWVVIDKNKVGRYPRAKHTGVTCYHYGWVRTEDQMNLKSQKVIKYWGSKYKKIEYAKIDPKIIKEFKGTHPKLIEDWLPNSSKVFSGDKTYKLNKKERKHRLMIFFERIFKVDLSKKHYTIL